MSRILFSPVGGTDPIKYFRDGSLLHIARVYQPDIIYLYLSKEILENHRKDNRYVYSLEKLGDFLNHPFEIHVLEAEGLAQVQHYDFFYHEFHGMIRDIAMKNKGEILLNMASGTPAMKSALLVLATLSEYQFKPIQVDSPKRKMNIEQEERKDYDPEMNWELNEDNTPHFENRCYEVKCLNLISMLKKDMIKKHILAYDYAAALRTAEEIKEDISKETYCMLKAANARIKLNTKEVNKLLIPLQVSFYPIKDSSKMKLFEYVLMLQIKIEKEELGDFIRAVTPMVVDIFTLILRFQCKFNVDDYCMKSGKDKIKKWDRRLLQKSDVLPVLDEIFQKSGGFREGPVYSSSLAPIILYKSQDAVLKQKVNEISELETKVRNVAAHEIISVTEEWFREKTGKTSGEIYALIKWFIIYAGIHAKKEDWDSYHTMNQMILEKLNN